MGPPLRIDVGRGDLAPTIDIVRAGFTRPYDDIIFYQPNAAMSSSFTCNQLFSFSTLISFCPNK